MKFWANDVATKASKASFSKRILTSHFSNEIFNEPFFKELAKQSIFQPNSNAIKFPMKVSAKMKIFRQSNFDLKIQATNFLTENVSNLIQQKIFTTNFLNENSDHQLR